MIFIAALIFGLVLLAKGAGWFIEGSAGLARRYHVSEFIIGITLLAFGTSLPEFIVSITASLSQSSELVLGNIVGSNIANIALVLGATSLFKPVLLTSESIIKRDIPFTILAGCVLFLLGFDIFFQNHQVGFNRLTLGDGLLLLFFFIIFLFYILDNLKTGQILESNIEEKEKTFGKEPLFRLWIKIVIGLIGVLLGGRLVVESSLQLSNLFGLSEEIIGLTIVAIGTSLPEAITSIVAILKKKGDLAIGNIIGSNIFNIFFILGVSSTISPLEIHSFVLMDMGIMVFFSLLLFGFAFFQKKFNRLSGLSLVGLYLAYIIFISFREFNI